MLRTDLDVLRQQMLLKDCKYMQSRIVLGASQGRLRRKCGLHELFLLGSGLRYRGAAFAG